MILRLINYSFSNKYPIQHIEATWTVTEGNMSCGSCKLISAIAIKAGKTAQAAACSRWNMAHSIWGSLLVKRPISLHLANSRWTYRKKEENIMKDLPLKHTVWEFTCWIPYCTLTTQLSCYVQFRLSNKSFDQENGMKDAGAQPHRRLLSGFFSLMF